MSFDPFTLKTGDNDPAWGVPLRNQYGEADEEAVNLTAIDTLEFRMRKQGADTNAIEGDMMVAGDPEDGVAMYFWDDTDTEDAGAGRFNVEVAGEFLDGTKATWPTHGYWTIVIEEGLDD